MTHIWKPAPTLQAEHDVLKITYDFEHGDADANTSVSSTIYGPGLAPEIVNDLVLAIEDAVEEVNGVILEEDRQGAEELAERLSQEIGEKFSVRLYIPTERDVVYGDSGNLATGSVDKVEYIAKNGDITIFTREYT